jgi:hypothetical protein
LKTSLSSTSTTTTTTTTTTSTTSFPKVLKQVSSKCCFRGGTAKDLSSWTSINGSGHLDFHIWCLNIAPDWSLFGQYLISQISLFHSPHFLPSNP